MPRPQIKDLLCVSWDAASLQQSGPTRAAHSAQGGPAPLRSASSGGWGHHGRYRLDFEPGYERGYEDVEEEEP